MNDRVIIRDYKDAQDMIQKIRNITYKYGDVGMFNHKYKDIIHIKEERVLEVEDNLNFSQEFMLSQFSKLDLELQGVLSMLLKQKKNNIIINILVEIASYYPRTVKIVSEQLNYVA